MLRNLCLLFAMGTAALAANAMDSMQTFGVSLLQPEYVFQERVPKVTDLSDYLKAVQASIGRAVAGSAPHRPASGYIVVAVRPGRKSNAWLDITPPLAPPEAAKLLAAAKDVRPLSVQRGVIVVALKVGLWGGSEPSSGFPSPVEWRAAAQAAG